MEIRVGSSCTGNLKSHYEKGLEIDQVSNINCINGGTKECKESAFSFWPTFVKN